MKLRIVAYRPEHHFWECADEQGTIHRVDLAVDGSRDSKRIGQNPTAFNGRTVEVEWLQPWEELAQSVRLLEAK